VHLDSPLPGSRIRIEPAVEGPLRVRSRSAARRPGARDDRAQSAPPRLLSARDPDYPLDARQEGVTGAVELEVEVNPEGYVERATVTSSSGDGRLDAAAVRAALTWRYRPARRDGQAISAIDHATFDFFRDHRR
jgi:protein TonB